ncbi:MAG: hypothetical protein HC772_12805 [Leptolyngbyaceae cyanobacterium CRU_2_3]|nr:hypothetical protein [Leptolyngbyaceae cyanobacterium CRU_2_3]
MGLAAGVITVALLAALGGGGWFLWKFLQSGNAPNPSPLGSASPNAAPAAADRFSSGERTLFTYRGNFDRDRGITAFAQGDYAEAVTFLKNLLRVRPMIQNPRFITTMPVLARRAIHW